MSARETVQAVAFVELCKEWFGEGKTGIGGVSKAAARASDPNWVEDFRSLWQRAGHLALVVPDPVVVTVVASGGGES
jgi:hypothetical protein